MLANSFWNSQGSGLLIGSIVTIFVALFFWYLQMRPKRLEWKMLEDFPLVSKGWHEELTHWSWEAIEPHFWQETEYKPDHEEWQRNLGGSLNLNTLKITFVDADGKRWLRTNKGTTDRIRKKPFDHLKSASIRISTYFPGSRFNLDGERPSD